MDLGVVKRVMLLFIILFQLIVISRSASSPTSSPTASSYTSYIPGQDSTIPTIPPHISDAPDPDVDVFGCEYDKGPVNCQVCASSKMSSANDIHTIPRLGAGQFVSANLAYYDFCDIEKEAWGFGGCTGWTINMDFTDDRNPYNYLISIAIVWVTFIFMTFFSIFCGLCCCWCRFCCCCCRGGTCGKRFPTRKTGCWPGFSYNKAKNTYGYSITEKMFARLFVLGFCFNILLFVCMGNYEGNQKFVPTLVRLTEMAEPLAVAVRELEGALTNFLMDVVSGPMAGLIYDLDNLLHTTISFQVVIDGLQCLIDATYGLPEVAFFSWWINETVTTILSIQDPLARIPVIFEGFGNETNRGLEAFYVDLENLGENLTALSDSCLGTIGELDNIDFFFNGLTNNDTGTSSYAQALRVFNKIGDPDDATSQGYPSQSLVDDVQSVSPCIPDLYANAIDSTSLADRLTVHDELVAVHTVLDRVPRYDQVVANMGEFNNLINWCANGDLFGNFTRQLDDTMIEFSKLNGITEGFAAALDTMLDVIYYLNFTELVVVVIEINSTLTTQIDWPIMYAEIDKFRDFGVIVPCLAGIISEFLNVNETIMELPEEVNEVFEISAVLNESLALLYMAADGLDEAIGLFESSINDADFGSMVDEIYAIQTRIRNATRSIDSSSFIVDLSDMESVLNATSLDVNFTDVNNALLDAVIDLSKYQWLLDWEASRMVPVRDGASVMIEDFLYLATGYCTGNNAVTCQVTQDCTDGGTTGPCNTPTTSCVIDSSTACTSDSDCSTTDDRCRVDDARFNEVMSHLTGTSNPNAKLNTDWASIYYFEGLSLALQFDTDPTRDGLYMAVDAINQVNTTEIISLVDGMMGSMDLLTDPETMEAFTEIGDSLGDIDMSDMDDQLAELNTSFAELITLREQCEEAKVLMIAIHDLHLWVLPMYMEELNRTNLDRIYRTEGLSGVLYTFTNMMDNMTGWWEGAQTFFVNCTTNMTLQFDPFADRLDAFQGDEFWDFGSVHWLSGISSPETIVHPPRDTEIRPWRVYADVFNLAYPDNKSCMTADCLLNEIIYIDQEPFSTMSYTNSTIFNVFPFGREQMVAAPYAIPIILMGLGMLMLLPFNPLVATCGTCSCAFTFVFVPWMFFFSGLFFPILVMLPGDLCYGMENFGYRFLENQDICGFMNGTGDSFASCSFPMDMGSNMTINLTMSFLGFYGNFFGACEHDYMYDFWINLAMTAEQFPLAFYEVLQGSMTETIPMKQPLLDVIFQGVNSSSVTFGQLFLRLGDVLYCEQVSGVYLGFKDALCCEVLAALYWACGSWCLISWALCCCGIPSTVMGRKRLRRNLWGAEYKNLVRDANLLALMNATDSDDSDFNSSDSSYSSGSSSSGSSSSGSDSDFSDSYWEDEEEEYYDYQEGEELEYYEHEHDEEPHEDFIEGVFVGYAEDVEHDDAHGYFDDAGVFHYYEEEDDDMSHVSTKKSSKGKSRPKLPKQKTQIEQDVEAGKVKKSTKKFSSLFSRSKNLDKSKTNDSSGSSSSSSSSDSD